VRINYEKYYRTIANLDITSETNSELKARCPFHDDSTASLSVNKETGVWKCFGSCDEGGNIFQFHARMFKMSLAKTEKDILIKLGEYKIIDPSIVDEHHKLLLKSKPMLQFLTERRGLTLETIVNRKLGCDQERVYIPVYDEDGCVVNIRRYLPDFLRKTDKSSDKMLSYKEGYGEARLYPVENLNAPVILLNEGEADCLLANQLGYAAITATSGAGSFKEAFVPLFKGKTVHICYDIDKPGIDGAEKIARMLSRVCKVKVIHLPIKEPKNGDFSDYILKHGYNKKDFDKLIEESPVVGAPDDSENERDSKVYEVALHDAGKSEYYYKHIEMPVIVSGKDLAPYFAPLKIELTCDMGTKFCKSCVMGFNQGKMELVLQPDTQVILQLINCKESQQKFLIRQKANINKLCSTWKMNVKEVINVEEIRVIPEIDYSAKDTEYVARQLYYIGYGIKTNRSYLMRGITLPDPNTQYVTQIITEAVPTQTSIDQFNMTEELFEKLKVFQVTTNVKDKIKEICEDLSYNVTKIYDRDDLITALDLVYHSVLQFKFQQQTVIKGWVECLILGDTRCGKTETVQKLITHYRLGEICTGENISYAGLVGGMSQQQQRWSISWGKIPLNDRRLIVIDEASSLDEETISNLSGLRSSGVAEIIKIQNEKTNARTRLIWISNPRSGRKLDTYNYGIIAIKELIGRVEDIARFDLAITAASSEVDLKIINTMNHKNVPHKYTTELSNKLILWAWSRKPDQVKIGFEAEKRILEVAHELGNKYSPQIPLIEAAEQRIKVAKLSVALAARLFSTEDGETIVVKPEHVDFVRDFLEQIFSKPSMAYDLFSLAYKQSVTLDDDRRKRLEQDFKQYSDWRALRELLLEYQAFRKGEIIDQMGYDIEEQRRLFKWMSLNKLIKSTPIGYVKQPVFTSLLKNIDEKEAPKAKKKSGGFRV
jgi:hypothetical protein